MENTNNYKRYFNREMATQTSRRDSFSVVDFVRTSRRPRIEHYHSTSERSYTFYNTVIPVFVIKTLTSNENQHFTGKRTQVALTNVFTSRGYISFTVHICIAPYF